MGALGGAKAIAGVVQNPTNPVGDIQALGALGKAYNAFTGGQGALSGTIGEVAPYLGPIAAGVGMALSDYQLLDPRNTPDTIKAPLAGSTIAKLPSGNSLLEYNGMGIGLGTQQTEGSGEVYQIGPNGQQHWIGQKDSGQLERDVELMNMTTGHDPNAIAAAANGGIAAQAKAYSNLVPLTAQQRQANVSTASKDMLNIYNSTGGAKVWGQDAQTWLHDMATMLSDISGGTEWGRVS